MATRKVTKKKVTKKKAEKLGASITVDEMVIGIPEGFLRRTISDYISNSLGAISSRWDSPKWITGLQGKIKASFQKEILSKSQAIFKEMFEPGTKNYGRLEAQVLGTINLHAEVNRILKTPANKKRLDDLIQEAFDELSDKDIIKVFRNQMLESMKTRR